MSDKSKKKPESVSPTMKGSSASVMLRCIHLARRVTANQFRDIPDFQPSRKQSTGQEMLLKGFTGIKASLYCRLFF